MELNAVEIFGYAASALIAFSLTRSSIVKLRWFNLFGASSFCVYGIIINAYPVAILNGFIALTNVFFLRKMILHTNHDFSILKVSRPSNYIDFFLDFHRDEILLYFPDYFKREILPSREFYFMMDGTQVVGLMSGDKKDSGEFVVDFDFVIPAYRDCRLGQFALGHEKGLELATGYTQIAAKAESPEHQHYLEQLGFAPSRDGLWREPQQN